MRENNGKDKSRQKEVSAIFCKKAFITLGSPVVPLLSTSKADSGLASEFRRDRAIYTAYERMLKEWGRSSSNEAEDGIQLHAERCNNGKQRIQHEERWKEEEEKGCFHLCIEAELRWKLESELLVS